MKTARSNWPAASGELAQWLSGIARNRAIDSLHWPIVDAGRI